MPRVLPAALLALSLFTVTFAVNLQAPLYPVYVQHSAAGATAVTLGFAAYVAGLMPALLLFGGLSDRVGRRAPVALALLLAAAATGLLVLAPGWPALVAARVLLGIGTGLATPAGTAFMAELLGAGRTRSAALIVTSATSLGFGGGALATGASLALQGPVLMPASYALLLAAAPLLAALALTLPQSAPVRRVSLLRLPVFPAGTGVFGAAMALAWSATGMAIAVVPLQLAAVGLGGWSGLVIFLAVFAGFLCQPLARRMTNARALALGLVLVPQGFALALAGIWLQWLALVLAGTCITSAASYGFTYLAALAEAAERAGADRARAAAGLFVYAYAGFSLPVILCGLLSDRLGLVSAMAAFAALQLLASALTAAAWRRGRAPGAAPAGAG